MTSNLPLVDPNEIANALAGADHVRELLVTLLSIGPNNIASSYYAIKSRVKSENSLREKVQKKIIEEKRSNYKASDVSDIVGLRILTIFSDDLLRATHDFLDFVSFCQSPQIAFCPGNNFDEVIDEIKVYTSPNSEGAYEMVYSALKDVQLSNRQDGTPKLEKKVAKLERPYSSIHILLKCISRYSKAPKLIPVEVQIRTVFEDAWGEVDHKLRYKADTPAIAPSPEAKVRKRLQEKRLSELKIALQGCGSGADLIKADDELQRAHHLSNREEVSVPISMLTRHQFNLSSSTALAQGDIASEFDSIEKASLQILHRSTTSSDLSVNDAKLADTELREQILALDDLSKKYEQADSETFANDDDFFYFSTMLKSLILVRSADLVRQIAGKPGQDFKRTLQDGANRYFKLAEDVRFKSDAFLQFRLSNYFYVRDELNVALEKCRQASSLLPNDTRIKQNGFVPILINRRLAFLSWKKRQKLVEEGIRTGVGRNFQADRQRMLLRDSVNASSSALKLVEVCQKPPSEPKRELAHDANNFVSYCWELRDDQGDESAEQIFRATGHNFSSLATAIVEGYGDNKLTAGQLDSICKAYVLSEDFPLARTWVQRLEKKLEIEKAMERLSVVGLRQLEYSFTKLRDSLGG